MSAFNNLPEPLKLYTILDTNSKWSGARDRQIALDGRTVYWIHETSGYSLTRSLTVTLRNNPTAPPIAAAKLSSLGWGSLAVMLGDPEAVSAKEAKPWSKTESPSMWKNSFSFDHQGRSYTWKNTHKSEYGASKWSSKDFKLVSGPGGKGEEGRSLALLVWDLETWKMRQLDPKGGQLMVFVELGNEVELLAVAVVLCQCAKIKVDEQTGLIGAISGS